MRSAPALTTASTSAPSRAKSADRIGGAIQAGIMGMLLQPVSRARASRYLSLVRAMISGGSLGPGAEAPARDHRAHERQVPRSPCAADRLKEHSHDARLDR